MKISQRKPKVAFDTNILKTPSKNDWIFLMYMEYQLEDIRRKKIRQILLLGIKHIELNLTETVYREIIGKQSNIEDFLNYIFNIELCDKDTRLTIMELSTLLAQDYSKHRKRGDPEPDGKDIEIYLETWYSGCSYLITEDNFLHSFYKYITRTINLIKESEKINEERGRIENLTKGAINEDMTSLVYSFLTNLIDIPIPEVWKIDKFIDSWVVDKEDYFDLYKNLISFKHNTADVDSTNSLVKLEEALSINSINEFEVMNLIDDLINSIAPNLSINPDKPPYNTIIADIISKTCDFLNENGIKLVSIELNQQRIELKLFNTGECFYYNKSSSIEGELKYDENFLWIENPSGDKDSIVEIEFSLIKKIIKKIGTQVKSEYKRKKIDRLKWKKKYKELRLEEGIVISCNCCQEIISSGSEYTCIPVHKEIFDEEDVVSVQLALCSVYICNNCMKKNNIHNLTILNDLIEEKIMESLKTKTN